MAKSSIDKELFSSLKGTLTQEHPTPTQRITEIPSKKPSIKNDEAPFTLWVPKLLMKKIKIKALQEETSIKDIILECIKKSI